MSNLLQVNKFAGNTPSNASSIALNYHGSPLFFSFNEPRVTCSNQLAEESCFNLAPMCNCSFAFNLLTTPNTNFTWGSFLYTSQATGTAQLQVGLLKLSAWRTNIPNKFHGKGCLTQKQLVLWEKPIMSHL